MKTIKISPKIKYGLVLLASLCICVFLFCGVIRYENEPNGQILPKLPKKLDYIFSADRDYDFYNSSRVVNDPGGGIVLPPRYPREQGRIPSLKAGDYNMMLEKEDAEEIKNAPLDVDKTIAVSSAIIKTRV